MENESKKDKNSKKTLAYVNIHKRTINLSKLGFLEEIKSDLINMHSRRDYKITLKGIEQLIPYFLTHPDEVGNTVQYMNKFIIDKKAFGNLLSNKFKSMIETMSLYIGSTTYIEPLPLDIIQIDHLQRATFEFNLRLGTIQQSILVHPQSQQSPQLLKTEVPITPKSKTSIMIEAQRSAELAAGLDPNKEMTKTLERVNKSKYQQAQQPEQQHYDYSNYENYPTLKNAFSTAMAARSNKNENILKTMDRIGYQTSKLPKRIQRILLKQAREYDTEEKKTEISKIEEVLDKIEVEMKKKPKER